MPEATIVQTPESGQPQQATQPQPTQTQPTQPSDQTATQRTAADPNAGRQTDPRDQGLIRDLQTERKARQALEQQLKEFRESSAARDQRLTQAITGTPAEDAETQELRAALAKAFPRLAHLAYEMSDEQFGKFLGLADHADALEQTTNWQWERHSQTMIDSVHAEVQKALGGELSDRQKKRIARAYADEAGAGNPLDGNGNPLNITQEQVKFLQRHNAGDKTLVAEFVKQWLDDWYEPARRAVTATEVGRQKRVPSGRDRSIGTQQKKPLDFKDEKAVADAMVESFRSHGGVFGD